MESFFYGYTNGSCNVDRLVDHDFSFLHNNVLIELRGAGYENVNATA